MPDRMLEKMSEDVRERLSERMSEEIAIGCCLFQACLQIACFKHVANSFEKEEEMRLTQNLITTLT